MNIEMKVLGPQNEAEIVALERRLLSDLPAEAFGGEFEKEMSTWKARWRKEALEHYLPLGWSFGIWDNGELAGYSLGQPLLFYQGFTQSLWVEHICASTPEIFEKLIEVSYRWSRDKHLQRVLFSAGHIPPDIAAKASLLPLTENILHLKTSKYE